MNFKLRNATIELVQGDITEMDVDAIVNAANNHLWMGGGVAGAIKRKGGAGIEEEAISKGPIGTGQAVATGAGRLKARFVIHAATMGQDLETDEGKIRSATAASLNCARDLRLSSIALPALGAGVGGFALAKVAEIMLEEVEHHLEGVSSLRRIVFALFGADAFAAFESALKKRGLTAA